MAGACCGVVMRYDVLLLPPLAGGSAVPDYGGFYEIV